MARKAFRLVLGPGDAGSWNAVLRAYADSAFPPGGSECSQASRAALTDLAERILQAGDHLDIGARQRPMLGAAVRWYSGSVADGGEEVRDRLLRRIERA